MTEPYVDAMTNERVITYAQELLDHHNVSHGVVGIDVLLKPVADYVTSVRLSEGGYSMLLSNDGTLLAHNDPNMIGKHLRDLSSDFASLAAELADEDGIFERRVTDATGSTSVVFVKRLYNGWYICMVASEKAYYSKVRTMAQVLFLMGLTFALILAIILLRLCLAQISADEANRTKTLFLARMSHDIRTPMNAIVGISELILHEPISRSVRAYTADVKQAGLNLLSLINDILDFSKIESGKMELNEAEYDLCLLIHDLVVIIKMRIAEAPVNFDVFIDSQLPAMLIGDEARIRQILLNLLSNAAKYTQKGEISLSIKGREISSGDDGGEIEIICEVQDSGIGIKPEDLGKLFGEFKRLDPQANAGVEGTGLGLAIARNLALMMNGDIAVSSEYGKGSVFVAKFRQRFKARACFAQVKNAAEKAVLVYEPRRAISAGWIIKTLENLGVYAEWVTTPETFERALGKRHYDFVFSWSFLAKGVMSALARHGMNTVPVLLDVRTGEPVPSGACALMLPAYSLSVANVLNGGTDGRYFAASKIGIHFTLPDVKALVVDDIEVNLRVAKGLMSYYEMQIDCALSGAEAILLARRNRYDIIFMDHMMPQMDGIEAVARLRALGGEFENLPIVALTANAISGMREMFLSCGFTDFLSKPIEMSKLSDILERWIPKTRRLERLSEKEEQQARVEISSASSAPIAPISGVDMALGLSRIGGKVEDYVEMLAAFVRDTEERLEKFDLSDIKTFVIHVHAFKAAAANVGASDVSAAAAALEAAGMANDKAAIAEHWDDFAASLKALNANIRAALQETQEATVGLAAQSTLEEREILIHLKTAIRDLDIDGMDTALERLQRVPLDLHWREQVAAIANMVLLARFDEALEVIEVLETASSLQRRGVKT
jgi:signal transduction histidine kinase/CheY-like chemotaxis protein